MTEHAHLHDRRIEQTSHPRKEPPRMKRFLYMLLAAAVAGAAPAPLAAEAIDLENSAEFSEILEDGRDSRQATGAGAQASMVLVRPLTDDEPLKCDGWGEALIVDRGTPHVASMRAISGTADRGDIASAHLLAAALRHAWDRGDLQVEIDSQLPLEDIAGICQRNRFLYLRTIQRDGRPIHRFVADLYTAQLRA
jgi:hypothetical protein